MSRSLKLSLISSFSVFLKILTGSNIFLIIFLLITLYGIVTDKLENKIEYLLFFISWIYVIKFNNNQFSLFIIMSMIYILMTMFTILKDNIKLNKNILISVSIFFTYIIFVNSISSVKKLTDILGFLIGYIVIVLALSVVKDKRKFVDYTFTYSIGISLAAIIGISRNFIPSVDNFLMNMTRLNTLLVGNDVVKRIAGLDLDPNYYASNILMAISLLLVCTFYKRGGKLVVCLIGSLFICGFLSFSKMYLAMSIFVLIYSIIAFSFNKPKKIFKYLFIIGSAIILGLALFGNYIFSAYGSRLNNISSINELTTGRFGIWGGYIRAIFSDLKIFLIGNGIGTPLNGHVSHNMYLLAWYYIGIFGIIVSIIFIISLINIVKDKFKVSSKFKIFSINNLPLIMILLLNLSLDSFFMDFFCYQLLLSIMSMIYVNHSNTPIIDGDSHL